jgi:hypothetical protein
VFISRTILSISSTLWEIQPIYDKECNILKMSFHWLGIPNNYHCRLLECMDSYRQCLTHPNERNLCTKGTNSDA